MENIESKRYTFPEPEDPAQEEETSFTEADNETLLNLFQNMEIPVAPDFDPSSNNPRLAAQRSELEKLKKKEALRKYFKDYLGISTSQSAGEQSEYLYDNSELILNKRSGEINGLEFKGKKIIVKKHKFAKDRRLAFNIQEFNDLLKKANREYQNTASSVVEEETGLSSTPIEENVVENTVSSLEEQIENLKSEIDININEVLSPQEIREANSIIKDGVLNQNITSYDKINFLEKEKKHWEDKKNEKDTPETKKKNFRENRKINTTPNRYFFLRR